MSGIDEVISVFVCPRGHDVKYWVLKDDESYIAWVLGDDYLNSENTFNKRLVVDRSFLYDINEDYSVFCVPRKASWLDKHEVYGNLSNRVQDIARDCYKREEYCTNE